MNRKEMFFKLCSDCGLNPERIGDSLIYRGWYGVQDYIMQFDDRQNKCELQIAQNVREFLSYNPNEHPRFFNYHIFTKRVSQDNYKMLKEHILNLISEYKMLVNKRKLQNIEQDFQ